MSRSCRSARAPASRWPRSTRRGARQESGAEPDTQSRVRPQVRRPGPIGPAGGTWWARRRTARPCSAGARRPPRRVEAGEQHGRRAGQQGAVDADAQSVGVEHGQAVDQPVVRAPSARPAVTDSAGGQQVPVAEHGPLGCAGGPRGVADEGRVVGRRQRQRPGVAVGQVDVGADHHHRAGRGPPHPVRLLGASTMAAAGRTSATMWASSRSV